MGYVSHTALLVTMDVWSEEDDRTPRIIHETVKKIMGNMKCLVTPLGGYIRGTYSFAVLPDGQKEGWIVSNLADERRDRVKEFLDAVYNRRPRPRNFGYKPTLLNLDWAEVAYGGDRYEAEVLEQSWRE